MLGVRYARRGETAGKMTMDERTPPDDSGEQVAAGSQPPTLKTIAFMTGLGVTTVSRALKDAPEIGAETKRRVQLVARQIDRVDPGGGFLARIGEALVPYF